MAAKLGSDDVSFRLGAGEVAAVYLGTQEVWSAVVPGPATLYFNGAVDDDWTEVGNWWLDDEHTEPAGRLPTSDESVVLTATVSSNSGSQPTVINATVEGVALDIDITVTGMATFNGFAAMNFITVTGNATFNGTSNNTGTVTGNATFNDSSQNFGSVQGTATFNDNSCNDGGIAGTFVPETPPEC
jgi:hypothetical protein